MLAPAMVGMGTTGVAAAAATNAPAASAPTHAVPSPAAAGTAQAVPSQAVVSARAPAATASNTSAIAGAADAPVAGAASGAASAPAATTATAATPAKASSGINFPVRPATTASTQAPSPAVGHASAADAGSIGGALFSLVLVVALILGLGWLAKRMPGAQRAGGNAQLKVVASVALGPRDRAVVVDVGGTQLLLGVGQGGVRALHTLERPLAATEAPGAPSPFAQILAQHFGRKP